MMKMLKLFCFITEMKQLKMTPVLGKEVNKSVFYKKSSYRQSDDTLQNTADYNSQSEQCLETSCAAGQSLKGDDIKGDNSEMESREMTADVAERLEQFSFVPSNTDFKFNFNVGELVESSDEKCEKAETTNLTTDINLSSYKMDKSDNSFQFNFSDPS